MKSLAELDAFLSRPDIGTVTVDRAPNNKTYVTVYVRRRENHGYQPVGRQRVGGADSHFSADRR